jgi:hypothetical protein
MPDTPGVILNYLASNDSSAANQLFQRSIRFFLAAALPFILFGAFISLCATSLPVSVIGFVFLGLMFVGFGGLCWLIAILGCRSDFRRAKIKRFLAIPLLVVLLFGLLLSDIPRLALFYIDKPALDRFASRWMSTAKPPAFGRAGLYELYEITPIPGGFVAYVYGSNGLGARGALAYSPKTPPLTHAGSATPAGGGWYFLCCDTD